MATDLGKKLRLSSTFFVSAFTSRWLYERQFIGCSGETLGVHSGDPASDTRT